MITCEFIISKQITLIISLIFHNEIFPEISSPLHNLSLPCTGIFHVLIDKEVGMVKAVNTTPYTPALHDKIDNEMEEVTC